MGHERGDVDLSDSDFRRAAALAIAYLGTGNSLIRTATDAPGNDGQQGVERETLDLSLTQVIQNLCNALGEDQGEIESVERYLLLAAAEMHGGEPVRHGQFTATTAHDLVWEFASQLWTQIYSTISYERISQKNSDSRLEHGDVESFQLEPTFVEEHIAAIRDNLRESKPINFQRFSVMIQLESAKAAALFATEKAIVNNDGSVEETPKWSKPDSPTNWADVFNISYNKMRELLKSQKIRNKKLGERLYMIALDDLPANSS